MFDAGRRPMGRLFYWWMAVMVAFAGWLPASGAAPIPQTGASTTTVADTILMADGTAAQGNLIITWPAFTTASGVAVAGGSTTVALGAGGALSVALVPNAEGTPAGAYYSVVYQLGPGEVRTEYWVVPTTSPANLAAVRTTPGSGVAAQPVSIQYVNSALAGKADDDSVVHLSGDETISGAKVFASAPSVPAPTSTGEIANKGYVDQAVSNVGAGNFLPTAGGTMTGPITLPAAPVAPLQAATKGYVDLGLTTKADLISGLVPANELGTGTANAGSCLLGNGTWGGCGSGSGNVSTNPSTGVSQNITQAAGTQFSTNNFAGIPYVVSSYNWPQGGAPTESCASGCTSGGLVAGTQATITLTPCPAGVDTSNNANAQYGVYISGSGTAEAVGVSGGSCTSGAASGTIIFTPGSSHAAGFTVGAANGGNQEAINVALAGGSTHAVIEEVPTGGANTANYNIFWPVFLRASKSVINGDGAFWRCYTRSTCLMVGDYAGSTGIDSIVRGLEFQSATNVDGARIASVAATSGLYTVNTSSNHNLVNGDWVILYYTTPAQTQEARVKVTVTSGTQFQYTLGSATFASAAGFGWAAIENTPIEVETNGTRLEDIKYGSGFSGGLFHQGVVVGNDQRFILDGMTNEGVGTAFRCDANFCSNMVYLRGDQGAAPVAYIHHLEAAMQCSGNGVRNVAGNTLEVADSVIEGTAQYSIYYAGGLQPWQMSNVYNETGACTNPFYPGSLAGISGIIENGANSAVTITGDAPIGGSFPQFVSGGTSGSQRNYYVVPKDSNLGTGPMMFIGTAQPATSGTSIPLYWPNPDLVGAGTRTFDILVTIGTSQLTAPYTGNAFSVVTGASGNCNTAGICTYTDTQGATPAYTIANAGWTPTLPFWPGAIILGNGASAYLNQCGQSSAIISTSYLPKVFCKRGVVAGTTYANTYTPYWGVYPSGDSSGNGNKNIGAQVVQIGPASGSMASGMSGALNFNPGPGSGVAPRQIITTMDGSPQQTFATPGYVRTGSAADSFIGTDTTGGVGTQDQTYGAPGGHNFYVNDAGTNSTHAKFNIGAGSATFNVPLTVNGSLAVTSGTVALPITGAGSQCLHVSSAGVVTGTGSDCGSSGGGGGSGTVNSGTASQIAMYAGTGTAVSGDSALTDSGSVLAYSGSGGISAASGAFGGNLTVNGQLLVAGPWLVNGAPAASAMSAAGTGTSSIGISNDGSFYISANAGAPYKIVTTNNPIFSGTVTMPVTGATQCLHVNSAGVLSGTGTDCGSGGGAVSSVFGRSGAVVAASGDYTVSQVTGAAPSASPIFSGTTTLTGLLSGTSANFTGNVTVGGQIIGTGPWSVSGPVPGIAITPAASTSQMGFDASGILNVSENGGAATQVAKINSNITGTAANLSGNPTLPSGTTGTTQGVNDGTNRLATDAFVLGQGSSASPNMDGVAAAGSATAFSRADHVHPTDTSRAPVASPTFTGTVTEPVPVLPSQTANYFFAAPNGSAGTPSFRAIAAADVPTLNQNTTGTAANLSGTPAVPNGTTATTQTVGDTSTKLATTAFATANFAAMSVAGAVGDIPKISGNSPTPAITDSGVLAGPYPAPWITAVRGGGTEAFAQNTVKMWGVVLTYPLLTSSVAYYTTIDNTANLYDIGIANSAGTIVLNVGVTAGTSFSPAAGPRTLNWTQGTKTLQPGKYYVVMTTNCATSCATLTSGGSSGDITFQNAGTAGTTSGGALVSFTPPADVWSWGANIPALVVK